MLSTFKYKKRQFAYVEVAEESMLVCHIRAETLADNYVPGSTIQVVKLLLQKCGIIFFHTIRGERLGRQLKQPSLDLVRQVGCLQNRWVSMAANVSSVLNKFACMMHSPEFTLTGFVFHGESDRISQFSRMYEHPHTSFSWRCRMSAKNERQIQFLRRRHYHRCTLSS